MRVAVLAAWLTGLWVVLWRDPTAGNLVGGLAASALVLALFPARAPGGRAHTLRPLRLLALVAWFARQLVASNLAVAREIVSRRDRIRSGIVEVPLREGSSDLVATVVADAITLTPGTLTLDVRRDPPALYVHVMHLHDAVRVREDIAELQRLVAEAIGSPGPGTAGPGAAGPAPAVAPGGAADTPPDTPPGASPGREDAP